MLVPWVGMLSAAAEVQRMSDPLPPVRAGRNTLEVIARKSDPGVVRRLGGRA